MTNYGEGGMRPIRKLRYAQKIIYGAINELPYYLGGISMSNRFRKAVKSIDTLLDQLDREIEKENKNG